MIYSQPSLARLIIIISLIATTGLLFAPSQTRALTMSPTRLEVAANRGETIHAKLQAFNEQKESKLFFISFQNFEAKDESGTPVFTGNKTDLASWTSGPAQVILGPGERKDVDIEIIVPNNAETGGHFAGAFLLNEPPTETGAITGVSVGSELGTLILLRVKGEFQENADIIEFSTTDHGTWYASLPIDFFYRFQNTGQDRAKPLGDIVVTNMFGGTSKIIPANPDGGNVLPRSIRRFEASWKTRAGETEDPASPRPPDPPPGFWNKVKHEWKYFALGRYKATLTLTYGQDQQRTSASAAFWVVPWQLLVVIIPSTTIALILLRFGIKRYNRWIIGRSQKQKKR